MNLSALSPKSCGSEPFDLLPPKPQRAAPNLELLYHHPENARVKGAGGLQVPNLEHDVVDAAHPYAVAVLRKDACQGAGTTEEEGEQKGQGEEDVLLGSVHVGSRPTKFLPSVFMPC